MWILTRQKHGILQPVIAMWSSALSIRVLTTIMKTLQITRGLTQVKLLETVLMMTATVILTMFTVSMPLTAILILWTMILTVRMWPGQLALWAETELAWSV